jgi:hypothetical protein
MVQSMVRWVGGSIAAVLAFALACGSSDGGSSGAIVPPAADDEAPPPTPPSGVDASSDAGVDAAEGGPPAVDTLADNRDRLLTTYLAFLKTQPNAQTNGLDGAKLADTCALWKALDPSSQDTFLTLTARMQGSKLPSGASMLSQVTKLYRCVGGDGATASDPGSCGGGENNRMLLSMSPSLQKSLVAANKNAGATGAGGKPDIADIPATSAWRESQDLGGPHAPFDLSDETMSGAPRGQTQYFSDPTSATATAALGRKDLETLIDPYALEMDQDYDCPHNSNPDCSYSFYGPACAPEANEKGTDIYIATYGNYDPAWQPSTCK